MTSKNKLAIIKAMEQDNLTNKQIDGKTGLSNYAVFLPAISTFYSSYIGKQQSGIPKQMIPANRIPTGFNTGIEGMNWFNAKDAYFPYKWSLYSSGHAELDLTKHIHKEAMTRNRDRSTSFLLGDSGGYQIGKAVWAGDWLNPNDTKTSKKRREVLNWLDKTTDYAMGLDVPAWAIKIKENADAINIHTYSEAVFATQTNNDYFIKHRLGKNNGGTRFLNVLQGSSHAESDDWYNVMKKYCDPTQYPENHMDGWAFGGQNTCDPHLVLRRFVDLCYDNLLEEGLHDWVHVLGTSRLEWALILTDIQNAVRKYHNPSLTISYDCASPFLATANGQVYYEIALPDRGKWSYRMKASVDDKKYATDHRPMRDAFVNDGHFAVFEDSPISSRCKISDICVYGPGHLNKIGKVGRTSWDSFSYAILMGHNVWMHAVAVQRANDAYIRGEMPDSLINDTFTRVTFAGLVDQIFSAKTREAAHKIIDDNSKFWTRIKGSRGFFGKKTINAHTQFNNLFDVSDEVDVPELEELSEDEAMDALGHLDADIEERE